MLRGATESAAIMGSSLLWLGLAAGAAFIPWWSDRIRSRKRPIVWWTLVQLAALVLLVYAPVGQTVDLALCFIFGFGNANSMLAFSTAADVVEPRQIGTSAAIVNGFMFIFAGIMISRPGMRADRAIEIGMDPGTMDVLQYSALPLVIAMALALVLALAMKETYPASAGKA
jgi:cyanate permease